MANVSVKQIESGVRIIEDVYTPMGGKLFSKGRLLNQRDIEILKAFLVSTVSVEDKQEEKEAEKAAKQATKQEKPVDKAPVQERPTKKVVPNTGLHAAYRSLFTSLKQYFISASSGMMAPVLDLRNQLDQVIAHIHEYNMLTFEPPYAQKGDYLIHNSVQVALTSYQLAKWHNIERKDWIPIAMAGLLHDIGMVRIDESIVRKADKLSKEELEEIRRHTIIGYNMLKSVTGINEAVKLTALQHHERVNGSGYPLGVSGDKIHYYAKIVAIADIFHAMTSDRAHQKGSSPYTVLEELLNESFGKLDPALVQTFIHKVTQFHNGTLVRLSDQSVGEIVFSDRSSPTRPWVNVNGKIINLTVDRHLHIVEVLST
ncbi:HD-GYP domain-containing protein [Xylanibacillus composti]|uniref:HD-GYP domain-containing protein n=1 Tax=Xylanibacillus composti TaxID=1572762 RepID=A0A8J4M2S7_9BACL|nr:HD-GYP domain-containing protein [Xylanibacillus composti]MDT9725176.1 HD-GYP domain-containing protein [Xylanibacillus composti]GIQ70024.1 hypothetical protein XYCOK13_28480 [Xylanibacillus composti]